MLFIFCNFLFWPHTVLNPSVQWKKKLGRMIRSSRPPKKLKISCPVLVRVLQVSRIGTKRWSEYRYNLASLHWHSEWSAITKRLYVKSPYWCVTWCGHRLLLTDQQNDKQFREYSCFSLHQYLLHLYVLVLGVMTYSKMTWFKIAQSDSHPNFHVNMMVVRFTFC